MVSKIYNKNSGTGDVTLQITTDGGGFVVSDFSSANSAVYFVLMVLFSVDISWGEKNAF